MFQILLAGRLSAHAEEDLSTVRIVQLLGWAFRSEHELVASRYKNWSEAVSKAPASVAVLYSSDYGFSDRLSQTIARGITKAGVGTEMMDLLSADPQVTVCLLPSM